MKSLIHLIVLGVLSLADITQADESVEIRYTGQIEIRDLEAGKPYLTNRKYLLKKIPQGLEAMKFTAIPGGSYKDLQAKVPEGATVYIALDSEKKTPDSDAIRKYSADLEKNGWKYFGKIEVTDKRMENLRILVKTFDVAGTIQFKGVGFVGTIMIAPDMELKGR
jgi:hypothetical protein